VISGFSVNATNSPFFIASFAGRRPAEGTPASEPRSFSPQPPGRQSPDIALHDAPCAQSAAD
jgi:hypothetical protein